MTEIMDPDEIAAWTERRARHALPPPTEAEIAMADARNEQAKAEADRIRAERESFQAELDTRGKHNPAQHRENVLGIGAAIAAKLGILPLSFEELSKEPEVPWRTPEGAQEARQRAFDRLAPEAYREAWDWAKVHKSVQRSEVEKIWGWEFGPRGLYVAGESGHSKTRAVFMLVRRLMVLERRLVMYLDGIEFSALCTRAFQEGETSLFRPLVEAEVLFIDDFAKRWTPATEEGAFTILERRTSRNRPLLCTLNYSTQDLFDMQQARGDLAAVRDITTPLIRRLVDNCEPVVL